MAPKDREGWVQEILFGFLPTNDVSWLVELEQLVHLNNCFYINGIIKWAAPIEVYVIMCYTSRCVLYKGLHQPKCTVQSAAPMEVYRIMCYSSGSVQYQVLHWVKCTVQCAAPLEMYCLMCFLLHSIICGLVLSSFSFCRIYYSFHYLVSASFSLSLPFSFFLSSIIYIYIYIYMLILRGLSLEIIESLSLSLSIYIYIYIKKLELISNSF